MDVVATDEKRNVLLVGECKWQKSPVGMDVLNVLINKVRKIWPDRARSIRLILFSGSGFQRSVIIWAEKNPIDLIQCEELV
jgi:uncharacterized protein